MVVIIKHKSVLPHCVWISKCLPYTYTWLIKIMRSRCLWGYLSLKWMRKNVIRVSKYRRITKISRSLFGEASRTTTASEQATSRLQQRRFLYLYYCILGDATSHLGSEPSLLFIIINQTHITTHTMYTMGMWSANHVDGSMHVSRLSLNDSSLDTLFQFYRTTKE